MYIHNYHPPTYTHTRACAHTPPSPVGRNIAEGLSRLGASPAFVSAVGDDQFGRSLTQHLDACGCCTRGVKAVTSNRTAVYTAVMDGKGDLVASVADMEVMGCVDGETVSPYCATLPPIVVADANIPLCALEALCDACRDGRSRLWFEPTSLAKTSKIAGGRLLSGVTFMSPNRQEVRHLRDQFGDSGRMSTEDCAASVLERMLGER